jgi:hypothetical protein
MSHCTCYPNPADHEEDCPQRTSPAPITEYACRFTAWTNTDGRDRQVVKYDRTGTGESGKIAARHLADQTRDWQPHHELPADAVVVSRPVAVWTVVEEGRPDGA